MRKFVIPLLAFAMACSDASVVEPKAEALFSPASAPWLVLTWQETFDQSYAGETMVTPSQVLQMRDIDNGFFVTGGVVGYGHVYGRAALNLRTGEGNGSGTAVYQLTEPGVGTLECNWHSAIHGFPVFVQYGQYTCKGTGFYEGWKVKVTGNNESNPGVGIYTQTAEIR